MSFPVSKASGAAQTEQSSPPVKSLMASARASMDSMSRLLVGSSCRRKKDDNDDKALLHRHQHQTWTVP